MVLNLCKKFNMQSIYLLWVFQIGGRLLKIISLQSGNVLILEGWEGSYSLEDSLAAGALASYLETNSDFEVNILNDELQAALALWDFWKNDIFKCLKTATHVGHKYWRL